MGHCNDQDHQGVYSILADVAKWVEDDLPGDRDTHSHLKKVYILSNIHYQVGQRIRVHMKSKECNIRLQCYYDGKKLLQG